MIRVLIVDDHIFVREGVSRLLADEPDMRVLACFPDGNSAVRFAARDMPDVAILDTALPKGDGFDVVRRLRAVAPATKLLMLSIRAQARYVRQAFWAGVNGYVLKESASREVVAGVRAVHAGQRYLGEEILQLADDPLQRLSAREMQVLKLVVEGNSRNQVATRLGLSPHSIATYRNRLMTKLGIADLPALVKFAIRRGLTSA